MSLYPKVYRNRQPKEAPAESLEDKSYDDLYKMAVERKLRGRSSMTRERLVEALS